MSTRIFRPLEQREASSRLWQALVGVAALVGAVWLYLGRVDFAIDIPYFLPALGFVVAIILLWSPLEAAAAGDARRLDISTAFARSGKFRLAVGTALLVGTLIWFSAWEFTDKVQLRFVVVPVVIALALALSLAPWWLRLIRQVGLEREQRVREFERAEIAAHLHDSVLQTLTLIRASADNSDLVQRLARAQERDLRQYLYRERIDPAISLASSLQNAVNQVEDTYSVVVEVVAVGDCGMSASMQAAVLAASEAVSNAARHAHEPISVYLEVNAQQARIFVRDSGPGFNLQDVPVDRLGISNSIIGRIERHGGHAQVISELGKPTEVIIEVPREE